MGNAFQDLTSWVNDSLKAQSLLQYLIGSDDDISTFGEGLRTYCPLHSRSGFKSLQVDPAENRAECILRQCPAHDSVSLVELFAQARSVSDLEAALAITRMQDLDPPPHLLDGVAEEMTSKAHDSWAKEDLPESRQLIRVALMASPEWPGALVLRGKLEEEDQDTQSAAASYHSAAQSCIEKNLLPQARNIVEKDLLRLCPDDPAGLELLGVVQRREDPEGGQSSATYRKLAQIYTENAESGKALEALEKAAASQNDSPEIQQELADALTEAGRKDEAEQHYRAAAHLWQEADRPRKALRCLSPLIRAHPADLELRVTSARLRETVSDKEGAVRDLEALARDAIAREDDETAQDYLNRLLNLAPNHLYGREASAELCGRQARVQAQVDHLFAAIEALLELELFDRILEILEKISALAPKTLEQSERLGHHLENLGRNPEAANQYLAVAEGEIAGGQEEKALEFAKRAVELDPLDQDLVRRCAALLSGAGLQEQSFFLMERHTRALFEFGETDGAERMLRGITSQFGERGELSDIRIAILLEQRDEEGAVPLLKKKLEESNVPDETLREQLFQAVDFFPENRKLADAFLAAAPDLPQGEALCDRLLAVGRLDAHPVSFCLDAIGRAMHIRSEDPEIVYTKGSLLNESSNPAEAIPAFKQAAFLFWRNGDPKRAGEAVEEAQKAGAKDKELREIRGLIALKAGRTEEGRQLLVQSIEDMMEQNRHGEVAETIERSRREVHFDSEYLQRVGEWLLKHEEKQSALNVYMAIAQSACDEGDWEEAVEKLDHCLSLDSDSIEARRLRGDAYLFLGEEESAARDLSHAASVSLGAGRKEEAVSCFEILEAHGRIDPEQRLELASAYRDLSRIDDAKRVLKDALEEAAPESAGASIEPIIRPLLELARDDPGLVHFAAKRAEALGESALAVEAWSIKADRELQVGNHAACIEALREACRLAPEEIECRKKLIRELAAQSNWIELREALQGDLDSRPVEEAAGIYDALDEESKKRPEILEILGELENLRGNSSRAIEIWESALRFSQDEEEEERPADLSLLRRLAAAAGNDITHQKRYLDALEKEEDREAWIEQALLVLKLYFDKGQNEEGERLAEKIQSALGRGWSQMKRLAMALSGSGRPKHAAGLASKALDQEGISTEDTIEACEFQIAQGAASEVVYRRLSQAQENAGNLEAAAEAMLRAIEYLYRQGDSAEAVALSREGFEKYPSSREMEKVLFDGLLLEGDLEAASFRADSLCEAHCEEEKWEDAESIACLMAEASPANLKDRRRLADIQRKAGKTNDAVSGLLEFADLTSDKEEEDSREALELACEYAPESGPAHESLAQLLERAGERGRALQHYRKAFDCLGDEHEEEKTESLLKSILNLDPEDTESRERLARHYLDKKKKIRALEQFQILARAFEEKEEPAARRTDLYEEILRIDHEDLENRKKLAILLSESNDAPRAIPHWVEVVELRLEKEEDPSQALAETVEALSHFPESPELRTLKADQHFNYHEYEEYIQEITGLIHDQLGKAGSEEAFELLRHSCSQLIREKRFEETWSLLGEFPQLLKDFPDLERFTALALEGCGKEAEAAVSWLVLADFHLEKNRPEEEITALRRSVALKPRDASLRRRLIEALERQEESPGEALLGEYRELAELLESSEPSEAISLYQEILERDDQNADVLGRTGRLLDQEGRIDEAADYYLRLGRVCEESGHLETAERTYRQVFEKAPDDLEVSRSLLEIYEKSQKREDYLALAPRVARLLDEQGDKREALEIWKQIAWREDQNREARQHIANLYQELGKISEACAALREYVRIASDEGANDEAFKALDQLEDLCAENAEGLVETARHHEERDSLVRAAACRIKAARLYSQEGEKASALREAALAQELDSWSADLLQEAAGIYGLLDEHESAAQAWFAAAERYKEAGETQDEANALAEGLEFALLPDKLHRRAELLELDEQHSEAASLYAQAADAWIAEGSFDKAEAAAEKSQALAPGSIPVCQTLINVYLTLQKWEDAVSPALFLGEHYVEKGERDRAIDTVKWVVERISGAEALVGAGRILRQAEESSAATAAYVEAEKRAKNEEREDLLEESLLALAELNPNDPNALSKAGQSLHKQGHDERASALYLARFEHFLEAAEIQTARQVFDEGLELVEDKLPLRREGARLYKEHEIPELAAKELRAIATELVRRGEKAEALGVVTEAQSLRPNDLGLTELYFELSADLGHDETALQIADQLTAVYLGQDERGKALDLLRKLIELRPDDPQPRARLVRILQSEGGETLLAREYRDLAELYIQLEHDEEAAQALRDLLDVTPGDTAARKLYIETYRKFGPEEDLVGDYLTLAESQARLNRMDDARSNFDRAVEISSEKSEPLSRFLEFLVSQGEADEAVQVALRLIDALLAEGHPQRAREVVSRLDSFGKASADFQLAAARVYREVKSLGNASRALQRAASLFSEYADHAREAKAYGQLAEIDPQNLENRRMLVEALQRARMEEEALEESKKLARVYAERGMFDLAETQYREILQRAPGEEEIWKALFSMQTEQDRMAEMIPDYLDYADMLAQKGEAGKAIEYYLNVLELDPRNLRAHRGYVTQYPKIGKQRDIIDVILTFAQLLLEEGEVDEGIRYFELIMAIDPQNTVARDMLSSTQSRGKPAGKPDEKEEGEDDKLALDELDISGTQQKMISSSGISPSDFLMGAIDEMERNESEQTLKQIEQNYRDILAVNPNNAGVRLKLADVLSQMKRSPEMMDQLDQAAEMFFNKGELRQCISTCERILKHNPSAGKARKRMNEAILKQDAFKALESAILFSDQPETDPPKSSGGGSQKTTD